LIDAGAKQYCTGEFLQQKVRVALEKLDYYGHYNLVSYHDSAATTGYANYSGLSVDCAYNGNGTYRTRGSGTVWLYSGQPITRTKYTSGVAIRC
jgi:hypothetical protein